MGGRVVGYFGVGWAYSPPWQSLPRRGIPPPSKVVHYPCPLTPSLRHFTRPPGPPNPKWIPLGVGEQEHDCDQPEAKKKANGQQYQTSHADVDNAGDDGESYARDRHHDTPKQMRDELFHAIDIGWMDTHAQLIPAGPGKDRLHVFQQHVNGRAFPHNTVPDRRPSGWTERAVYNLFGNGRSGSDPIEVRVVRQPDAFNQHAGSKHVNQARRQS